MLVFDAFNKSTDKLFYIKKGRILIQIHDFNNKPMKELTIVGTSVMVAVLILALVFTFSSVLFATPVSAKALVCLIWPNNTQACNPLQSTTNCCVTGAGNCPGNSVYRDTGAQCCVYCENTVGPDGIIKDFYAAACCQNNNGGPPPGP